MAEPSSIKEKLRRDDEERDPQLLQIRFVNKFLDKESVPLLTEWHENEIKTKSKRMAFIKYMKTPLYTMKDGVKTASGPVALEEAFDQMGTMRVSLERKSRMELLKALGRTVINSFPGMAVGSAMEDEPEKKGFWSKLKFW